MFVIKTIFFHNLLQICFSDKNEIKTLSQELPFYNVSIEKLKIKKLKNLDMLSELPFCDKLNIVKTAKTFNEL